MHRLKKNLSWESGFNRCFSKKHPQEHSHLELTPIKSLSRDEYLNQIKLVQGHLQRGDIYEMNFCQEFVFFKAKGFDPYWRFQSIDGRKPNAVLFFHAL